jgi:ketosteroid isomerase-like protein
MNRDHVRSLIEQVCSGDQPARPGCVPRLLRRAYESEQPLHPERSFRGREGVRRNWSANLARVPDLRWDLVDACFSTDAAWSEWRWHGARRDGTRLDLQGVVIYGIDDGRIVRGRLYMGELPERTDSAAERPAAK